MNETVQHHQGRILFGERVQDCVHKSIQFTGRIQAPRPTESLLAQD